MPIHPLMICGAFGFAALIGAGAHATTVLPLGTEGRVAAWVGGTCGRATAGLVQVEDGIRDIAW